MKNILVTGSSGYIGSVLLEFLTNAGYQCRGIDIGFFKNCNLTSVNSQNIVFKDAAEIEIIDLEGIDVLVHLAGISNDPLNQLDSDSTYDPSREYTYKIAKLCKLKKIKFIFASSCSVYGKVANNELVDEISTPNPQTGYSLNKLQIENDLMNLSDNEFSPIALRFATIFGYSPRIRFDVVVNMFIGMSLENKLIVLNSDGQSWRPHLHILDACEAIKSAIELQYNNNELLILNVGRDDNNLKTIKVAEIVANSIPDVKINFLNENPNLDKTGLIKDRKIKYGKDKRSYKVSFKKINKLMPNFVCKFDLKSGIEDTVLKLSKFFDKDFLNKKEFFRLQYLEYLYSKDYLTKDLKFKNKQIIE